MPVELVLTGYPKFWPQDDKSAVYLGPWCFANHFKYQFYEYKNFNLIPPVWTSHQKMNDELIYINNLMDRMIPFLASYLNHAINSQYSKNYWLPIISGWLSSWLSMTYDRYLTVLQALSSNRNFFVHTITISDHRKFSIKDLNHHFLLINDHLYNLSLFSDIITSLREHKSTHLQINQHDCSDQLISIPYTPKQSFITKILLDIFNFFEERSDLIIEPGFGFSKRDILHLYLSRFFHAPLFKVINHKNKQLPQSFVHDFNPTNEFEFIVKDIFPKYLPECFFHSQFSKQASKTIIVPGTGYSKNLSQKIASINETSGNWYCAQHGGGYGQLLALPQEKLEYGYSKGFISHFSSNISSIYQKKIHSLPSPYLSKLKTHKKANDHIIMCANFHPVYLYRLQSTLYPQDILSFINDDKNFINSLNNQTRARLRYRPYFTDYGTNASSYIFSKYNNVSQIKGGRLTDHLRECNLAIINYPGTVLLEAMTMNVPLVFYWQPKIFGMNIIMNDYLKKFSSLGIYFENSIECAKHVNQISPSIIEWWHQKEIQELRKQFCLDFCYTDKNWFAIWKKFAVSIVRNHHPLSILEKSL